MHHDARLPVTVLGKLVRTQERIVELSNGCICCTLREDLLVEVAALAREGRFDHLVIESTGISEPPPVAETFTFAGEDGHSLGDLARLDTMATVVDAGVFARDLGSLEELHERGEVAGEGDERSVVDLLLDQVEFADVLVVNKTDRLDATGLAELEALLRRLNPRAHLVRCERGRVDPAELIGTGRFDFDAVAEAPGWLAVLRGEEASEEDEYGFSSVVFRAERAFHPRRLWAAVNGAFTGVVRSKGFFWLATRPRIAAEWSTAGGVIHLGPAGAWIAPEDRRQELVFIGLDLDAEQITATLTAALLTDAEQDAGPDSWAALPDPWPVWPPADAWAVPEGIAG